jgi:L-threonylcarbamoyladenylate synthase
MEILNKRQVEDEKIRVVRALRDCVFIHPTDTIYGIGCDATDRKLVRKLRMAKEQFERPLSVIAPSIDWIYEHCDVSEQAEDWLDKLPGPYTFILPLADTNAVAHNTVLNGPTIGVRYPDHWFTDIVADMHCPVITTSANVSGRDYMQSLDDLHDEIRDAVDIAIYTEPIDGNPSTIVDLSRDEPKTIRA